MSYFAVKKAVGSCLKPKPKFIAKVFDLYQLKKQTKAAPLTTQDIVFTKLDPTEGVKVSLGEIKPLSPQTSGCRW